MPVKPVEPGTEIYCLVESVVVVVYNLSLLNSDSALQAVMEDTFGLTTGHARTVASSWIMHRAIPTQLKIQSQRRLTQLPLVAQKEVRNGNVLQRLPRSHLGPASHLLVASRSLTVFLQTCETCDATCDRLRLGQVQSFEQNR